MTPNELRQAYIDFFVARGHQQIPAAPLIPTDDATTLFTSSGMQQLVPYLKGEDHPQGTRLVDSQPSFRAEDIDEVGDNRHTTFFEMLGNWSLGDYFKRDQIPWIFEFFTQTVGLDPDRLYVSVFEGSPEAPCDDESIQIWQKLFNTDKPAQPGNQGFDPATKIYSYPASKNWWSRAGVPANMPPGEIGGPDSEVFFDFDPDNKLNFHQDSPFKDQPCHINCDCGRFLEIGNSVFMEFEKQQDGSLKPLPAQNVDFGGGFERILAASEDQPDIFLTQLFQPIIQSIEKATNQSYQDTKLQPAFRVIADHLKAAVFIAAEGIEPSNKLQGYILRRLLRRSMVKLQQLSGDITTEFNDDFYHQIVSGVFSIYKDSPFDKSSQQDQILNTFLKEKTKFARTLKKGLKQLDKLKAKDVTGEVAFDLFQTYGFPFEITQELVRDLGHTINKKDFDQARDAHSKASRTASAGMFKGGLADNSETVTKLHTATHLLHAALHHVLGDHVRQEGSNITAERLRFDFAHPAKLTEEEKQQVEDEINRIVKQDLPVTKSIEDRDQALKSGAYAFFKEKYPDRVSVYTIGDSDNFYSKEFCGGPHVSSTGQIGAVTIKKEQSVASGIRRIYATLDPKHS